MRISLAQNKNRMIRSGIDGLKFIKLMWAITSGRDALLATTKTIIKQQCGATRWEAARGTNIGHQTNYGTGRLKKKVALTYKTSTLLKISNTHYKKYKTATTTQA